MSSYDDALSKLMLTGKKPELEPHKAQVRIPMDLWLKFQHKRIKERTTFTEWVNAEMREYVKDEQGSLQNISATK